ncbi:probable protein phosphatase 2C 24 [Euphorbia lathyris]|uniref:probable protein phosphatase 2C 24 n=1 Tax=Euphorbia lathyris TaxID=212925 RepID=UPI003314145A
MAEICRGFVSDSEASATPCQGNSRAASKRMEIRRFKFVAEVASETEEEGNKRRKIQVRTTSLPSTREEYGEGSSLKNEENKINMKPEKETLISSKSLNMVLNPSISATIHFDLDMYPKYGVASVCGRRRDMEDAVAVHPSFFTKDRKSASEFHYFGVYDGHGCSHVAARCRDRLHELVKEQLIGSKETTAPAPAATLAGDWRSAMVKSFWRMDKEVIGWNEGAFRATCRCEMQTPECDAVGSTAVVAILTPSKIIVANCGDSRAVLCRNGKPVPLSTDHKPDRPDELNRIQAAGGRVIYWDCPRVLGVLAMSRSIGDNYLKPYVSCEPEVTITERTAEDECLVLASDGLWDVVSNETACGVARMCLRGKGQIGQQQQSESCGAAENEAVGGVPAESSGSGEEMSDKACTDASMLLTKLALARHSTDNVSVVVVDLRKDT